LNVEGWNRFAQSFYKIDRSTKSSRQAEYIPSTFDIHYSIFDIRFFNVSFPI